MLVLVLSVSSCCSGWCGEVHTLALLLSTIHKCSGTFVVSPSIYKILRTLGLDHPKS